MTQWIDRLSQWQEIVAMIGAFFGIVQAVLLLTLIVRGGKVGLGPGLVFLACAIILVVTT